MAARRSLSEPSDVERSAVAAYLAGREDESLDLLTRAHNLAIDAGDRRSGARAAFWLAFQFIGAGDQAQASGWLGRARRLLDEHADVCVECGYVLLPQAMAAVGSGDVARAETMFGEAEAIGQRFHDANLVAFARHGRGRVLIGTGRTADGVALLDEVMVSVTSGELMPIIAGVIYCSVIAACFDLFDVRRAQEWTAALNAWCAAQPGLVPYRGDCLVHRSVVLRLRGRWRDAIGEATQASALPAMRPPARASAFYELGEIHRLEGETDAADEAYRRAAELGRLPHPGLALLRLAQGQIDAARAAISRALAEHRGRHRSSLLAAAVEIFVAAQDVSAARSAAAELQKAADTTGSPWLRAMARHAEGTVLIAERRPDDALARLQEALAIWRELEMPYDEARTQDAMGAAFQALGDDEGARLARDTASRLFRDVGAAADLARVGRSAKVDGGLTPREVEVLRLVARGQTNRAIAEALDISEKTVARHLSNIFTKLDLSTRAAATAYAFRHGLVD
jgi:DNA-binding CsgD family transcriptional regulator/predicted negative regulator of RcsB-dependent stress response